MAGIEEERAPEAQGLDAGRLQGHVIGTPLGHQSAHDYLQHHLNVGVVRVHGKHLAQLLHEPRALHHVTVGGEAWQRQKAQFKFYQS